MSPVSVPGRCRAAFAEQQAGDGQSQRADSQQEGRRFARQKRPNQLQDGVLIGIPVDEHAVALVYQNADHNGLLLVVREEGDALRAAFIHVTIDRLVLLSQELRMGIQVSRT